MKISRWLIAHVVVVVVVLAAWLTPRRDVMVSSQVHLARLEPDINMCDQSSRRFGLVTN